MKPQGGVCKSTNLYSAEFLVVLNEFVGWVAGYSFKLSTHVLIACPSKLTQCAAAGLIQKRPGAILFAIQLVVMSSGSNVAMLLRHS